VALGQGEATPVEMIGQPRKRLVAEGKANESIVRIGIGIGIGLEFGPGLRCGLRLQLGLGLWLVGRGLLGPLLVGPGASAGPPSGASAPEPCASRSPLTSSSVAHRIWSSEIRVGIRV